MIKDVWSLKHRTSERFADLNELNLVAGFTRYSKVYIPKKIMNCKYQNPHVRLGLGKKSVNSLVICGFHLFSGPRIVKRFFKKVTKNSIVNKINNFQHILMTSLY